MGYLNNTGLTHLKDTLDAKYASKSAMTGATGMAAGTAGLVPAPAAGDQAKYLTGAGTWDTPAARHGTGDFAVVEGSLSGATGTRAHAEGYNTTASGYDSHAEGNGTTASGSAAHAEGSGTIANHKCQHVFGEFNIGDASSAQATERGNYVEIVGNGAGSFAKSNARTLDWSGNEVLAGTLITGGDITVPSGSKFNGSGAGLTNIPASAVPAMTGATSSAAGTAGLVPAPSSGDEGKVLLGSGTWAQVKTINNETLIGSGNITISGGSSLTAMTDMEIVNAVESGWGVTLPQSASGVSF